MKLPTIDAAPVRGVDTEAIVGPERRRSLQVLQTGLEEIGKEFVRSQQSAASADLTSRLNEIQTDLTSRKFVDTEYVKQKLGGSLDALPPEIRAQVTTRTVDEASGQDYETDRTDIPMYAVQGQIFDAQARAATAAVSQGITGSGWQADFQEKAQQHIIARKAEIGREAVHAAVKHIAEQDLETSLKQAASGDFIGARDTLGSSRAMEPALKEKALSHVLKIEQTKPLYEAIQKEDVGAMAVAIGKLNDPNAPEFNALDPHEKMAFSERFRSEIKQFQSAADHARKAAIKAIDDNGWNTIFTAQRAGAPVTLSMIPPPGTGSTEQQKEMIGYVLKLQKGEKPETDWAVYAGLTELANKNKDQFAQINLMSYRNKLADTEFKHLLEVQQSAKGQGHPDAYDTFQNTDEAINFRIQGYKIDPYVKDETPRQRVGYLKTIIQHELAAEQKANGGKALALEVRDSVIDRVLKREVHPSEGWLSSLSIPAMAAGVPASEAATFRRAVAGLDPKASATEEGLKKNYQTFSYYQPMIAIGWAAQVGKNARTDDMIRAWYHLESNWGRLEGRLRQTGGWTEDETLRKKRLVQMAVQEITSQRAN